MLAINKVACKKSSWKSATLFKIHYGHKNTEPVPVAARSKAYVCGYSPAETVGSNPAGGMDVCLLWADRSSRGVLRTVVRRCVWSRNLKNEEATARVGPQRQNKIHTRPWSLCIMVGHCTNRPMGWTWSQYGEKKNQYRGFRNLRAARQALSDVKVPLDGQRYCAIICCVKRMKVPLTVQVGKTEERTEQVCGQYCSIYFLSAEQHTHLQHNNTSCLRRKP